MTITAIINVAEDVQVTAQFEKFSEVSAELDNIIRWAKSRREEKAAEVRNAQAMQQNMTFMSN